MEHSSGTQFLFQHWTPCQTSQPARRKNTMQEWEQEKIIKQEHQEFQEQGIQPPQKQCKREYQYYTDFVNHTTQGTNLDISVSLLAMSGSAHRLIEIIMTKPHDIDAKNLAAADLLFFLFNLAEKSGFHIKDIERSVEFTDINDRVANLSKAMKDMVLYHTMHVNIMWPNLQELQTHAQDIACKTIELVNAKDLHALLSLSIQKRPLNDIMMDARFKHSITKPLMKFALECNSIYPIIYMIPANTNALFLALLENSGLNNAMQYLYIDDVITRIQAFMTIFMTKEKMTLERANAFLTNIINGKPGTIDITDRNTLLWPVSHCLEMKSFEFNWNTKYPKKYPLVPIEDKWINKDDIILHRTNNVSCLPFKKKWLDISTTNGNNYNELQLLTEEDLKWLESLSDNPTLN
jgi:hypothetical protein